MENKNPSDSLQGLLHLSHLNVAVSSNILNQLPDHGKLSSLTNLIILNVQTNVKSPTGQHSVYSCFRNTI